jgi:hypothetical protein
MPCRQAVEDVGTQWGLLEVALQGEEAAALGGANHAAAQADACISACAAGRAPAAEVQHRPIVLQPSYFAMHFLVRCLPRGCRFWHCKQLGTCGVWVQHSQLHFVLVYLNVSSSITKRIAVQVPHLPQCDSSSNSSAAAGSSGSASQQPDSFGTSQTICGMQLSVHYLHLAALQPVVLQPGVQWPPLLTSSCQQQFGAAIAASGTSAIQAPPLHLVRADIIFHEH